MLRPTAKYVTAKEDYILAIEFDNGEKKNLMLSHISKANGMANCKMSIISSLLQ